MPPLKLARRQASDVSEAGEMSARSTGWILKSRVARFMAAVMWLHVRPEVGVAPLPSYAEEWRRASLDGSSIRARPASRGQSRSSRAPILDGVNAIEDSLLRIPYSLLTRFIGIPLCLGIYRPSWKEAGLHGCSL